MKKVLSIFLLIFVIFFSVGCNAVNNDEAGNSDPQQENQTALSQDQESGGPAQSSGGTAIILTMNGTDVHGTLNDTLIAQEFAELLPYSVAVSRAADDLCGGVRESLESDPTENFDGWKIGQIGWFGGWFTILVDNEENFADMSVPIIGAVDEEDLAFVQSMTGRVEIEIRLAEDTETTPDLDADSGDDPGMDDMLFLKVGETVLTATLAENSSAESLKGLIEDGPIAINMRDYGNMEKVGSIGTSLPRNDERITTEPGDLILYQGEAFVIYYEANTWNFTRLGKVNDVTREELQEILGEGSVQVTLSLDLGGVE